MSSLSLSLSLCVCVYRELLEHAKATTSLGSLYPPYESLLFKSNVGIVPYLA
jgi:hypothetical protein